MPIRIGIVGLGFMGKMHYEVYRRLRNARVVAICDVDPRKRSGDWSAIGGNIGETEAAKTDLSGIGATARLSDLLGDDAIDVIDITTPTDLHAEMAIAALRAGKHVICEKPMARTSADAKKMVAAARKAKGKLFVGHCIRFWGEYARARRIVRSRRYGKVISAIFQRISPLPRWGHRNWLLKPARSGLAAMDLHIHDADYVLYLFGRPKAVRSAGAGFKGGRLDHIVTTYEYPGGAVVMAEGAWEYPAAFPFAMSFRIAMEKAALCFDAAGLVLYPLKGRPRPIPVRGADGYVNELKHFLACIQANRSSDVVTPRSALQSVQLIEAEVKSARGGRPVAVRFY